MSFKSEKQQRFMFARHPQIAKSWVKKYGPFKPARKKALEGLKR